MFFINNALDKISENWEILEFWHFDEGLKNFVNTVLNIKPWKKLYQSKLFSTPTYKRFKFTFKLFWWDKHLKSFSLHSFFINWPFDALLFEHWIDRQDIVWLALTPFESINFWGLFAFWRKKVFRMRCL